MKSYHDLLRLVLAEGTRKGDRTGTGTTSIFGAQFRHRLCNGFPLLTTKSVHFHSVVHELLWFLAGDTNIKYLKDNKVRIWNEWADADGNLGPVYGKQWHDFSGVNQIADLCHSLRNNPDSRRHIVSAWNPPDVPSMKLPPCHCFFQCYVVNGYLSLHSYQRSADLFLGVPFNIASYALLLGLLGKVCGLTPYELVVSYGDLHIYDNHHEQVREQLSREHRKLPFVSLSSQVFEGYEGLRAIRYEDITLHDYNPHPAIKAPVAV